MAQTILAHCLESNPRTEDVTVHENTTFDALMLQENIIKGLKDAGFKKPSPIQLKAIPIGRCGFDIIIKAKSGTGKTLVFSIIALELIDVKRKETQVLILTPTREIAVQIQEVLTVIGKYFEGLKVEYFIGGLSLEEDKKKCVNCHIAVGPPGRIKHLIIDGFLKVKSVNLFVLDEVDKLLDTSFISDINEIFNSLPSRKQIIAASATYPDGVSAALKKYMLSHTQIEIENNTPLLLGLRQFVQMISPYNNAVQEMKHKNEVLLKIFSTLTFTQCIIFTNYQTRAESISNFLEKEGWNSVYISSVRSQCQRLKTMKDLKNFKCKIMLSTDLTARGIDAVKVDLIINYDIPLHTMTYLHRMGRAGRYGSTGICIDFATEEATLKRYKDILGAIGGCSLGVPKFPNFHGSIADLLKVPIPEENYIFGTVSDTSAPKDISMSIRKTVQKLTKVQKTENFNSCGRRREQEVSKKSQKETYLKNKALLYVTEILSNKKFDDVQKSDGDKVLHDYLQIIENGEKNQINAILNNTKHRNVLDLLQEQLNSTFQEMDANSLDTSCKVTHENTIKANSEHSTTHLPEYELKKPQNLTRKANLSINSNECEEEYEESEYVEEEEVEYEDGKYGSLNNTSDFKRESSTNHFSNNVNGNDCNEAQQSAVKPTENIDEYLNNLFKVNYDCAIKCNSKHWTSCLSNSESKVLQQVIYKENHPLSYDEYDDDEEDENEYNEDVNNACEIEYELPTNSQFNSSNYSNGNWWTSTTSAEQLPLYFQKYGLEQVPAYFGQCSNNLWWNGLNFTKAEDFNNWFYNDWQAQVANVRNYIQQKIYIEEIKNSQQSKNS